MLRITKSCSTALKALRTMSIGLPVALCLSTSPAWASIYQCNSFDDACVENFNDNASRNMGMKRIDVVRVTTEGRTTPSRSSINNKVKKLKQFLNTSSRNQLNIEVNEFRTKQVRDGSCAEVKRQAHTGNKSSMFFTIYVLPKGVCGSSNAGAKKMNLNDNLFRSYAHEAGHLLGLAHSNRLNEETGEVDYYGGFSSLMGRAPAPNYAISQLHWLGWTDNEDVVKINPEHLENGGYIEVSLRPIDRNEKNDSNLPIAYVYDLPNNKRLFISIPKSIRDSGNRTKGGDVFFHEAPKCQGCTGISMNSLLIDRITNPQNQNEYAIHDLTIIPVGYEKETVRVKIDNTWRNEDKYSSVTLRISKTITELPEPDPDPDPEVFGVDQEAETILNNNHKTISYKGKWYTSRNRRATDYNRDVKYTYRNGSSFSHRFTGHTVSIYMPQSPRQGDIEVYIDGQSQGLFSTHGARYKPQFRAFHIDSLSNTQHSIKVVKRSGKYMHLDAIGVSP